MAKRWLDEMDVFAAIRANEAFGRPDAFFAANLADSGIEQIQTGVEELLGGCRNGHEQTLGSGSR